MNYRRHKQRIFVTRRKSDGKFLREDKGGWTDEVVHAHLISRTKFKGLIRADLGLNMDQVDMVEVEPMLKEQ